MKKNKIVYVPMGADIIHSGHLNILNHARKYGEIIIGLFTDSAIAEYKSLPLINYQQRYDIIKNIRGVKKVIAQDTWDYSKNLNKIKPDFVVHGDDWKKGIQKKTRENVIKILKKWSGKLIEPRYTKNINVTEIRNKISNIYEKIDVVSTKEGRKESINKLREEIKRGTKKERYLSKEDAKLINQFLNKIKKELQEAEQ